MFCGTLLYVHSSIAIILIVKRELVALLNLSSCGLVMVEWLFLVVPWGRLRFVIVVFPDHTHLLFYASGLYKACLTCDPWLTMLYFTTWSNAFLSVFLWENLDKMIFR